MLGGVGGYDSPDTIEHFLRKPRCLRRGSFTCAGHDTLTENRKEVNLKPAVIGRKGNAKKWQGHIQKWRV